jgi:hypothetical protein
VLAPQQWIARQKLTSGTSWWCRNRRFGTHRRLWESYTGLGVVGHRDSGMPPVVGSEKLLGGQACCWSSRAFSSAVGHGGFGADTPRDDSDGLVHGSGVCFVKPISQDAASWQPRGAERIEVPRGCMGHAGVEAVLSYRPGCSGHAWAARVIWLFRAVAHVVRPRLNSLIWVFENSSRRMSKEQMVRLNADLCARTGPSCCMHTGVYLIVAAALSTGGAPSACMGDSCSVWWLRHVLPDSACVAAEAHSLSSAARNKQAIMSQHMRARPSPCHGEVRSGQISAVLREACFFQRLRWAATRHGKPNEKRRCIQGTI